MTTQPQPAPKPAKSRLLQDGRDMFWSIAPLMLACIVLAGVLGMCSFQASGPAEGPAPTYDAPGALQADADALKIPIRLPQLPENGSRTPAAETASTAAAPTRRRGKRLRAVSSTVGYLAPSGMYVSLTQSNADEDKLVGSIEARTCIRRASRTSTASTGWSTAAATATGGPASRCGRLDWTARRVRRRLR